MKAIETVYKGYRFRSRLEARWAVAFDFLGIQWEYEKEGFDLEKDGWYLPDFWLPERKIWVEVKGTKPKKSEKDKAMALADHTESACFIVTNIPDPFATNDDTLPGCVPYPNNSDLRLSVKLPDVWRYRAFESMEARHDLGGGWGVNLGCPVCGYNYVHFNDAENKYSNDDYKAWAGRGDAIYIPMWGECGHHWVMRIGFHKGFTFIGIENATEDIRGDLLYLLANGDINSRREACQVARQARFEHGETPTFTIKRAS